MRFFKKLTMFALGGALYTLLELLWRGRSHGSMFLLGGGCFLMLGRLRRMRLPLPVKLLLGTAGITAGELATGLLVNRNFAVWDYRTQPLNFLGQICLGFSLLWIPVSLLGMRIYGAIEKRFSSTR
jgi:uncharacterized membrane protein